MHLRISRFYYIKWVYLSLCMCALTNKYLLNIHVSGFELLVSRWQTWWFKDPALFIIIFHISGALEVGIVVRSSDNSFSTKFCRVYTYLQVIGSENKVSNKRFVIFNSFGLSSFGLVLQKNIIIIMGVWSIKT